MNQLVSTIAMLRQVESNISIIVLSFLDNDWPFHVEIKQAAHVLYRKWIELTTRLMRCTLLEGQDHDQEAQKHAKSLPTVGCRFIWTNFWLLPHLANQQLLPMQVHQATSNLYTGIEVSLFYISETNSFRLCLVDVFW